MWKPRVNAICSRAASRFEADAARGSGSNGGMAVRLALTAAADRESAHARRRDRYRRISVLVEVSWANFGS